MESSESRDPPVLVGTLFFFLKQKCAINSVQVIEVNNYIGRLTHRSIDILLLLLLGKKCDYM